MTILLQFGVMSWSAVSFGQAWSPFLDTSRAATWAGNAGFTIPSYTVACATQPTLSTGSGNASANAAAIQNALSSCDSTHNVVNLPSGSYYVAGIQYPAGHGSLVLRGAGASSTYLFITAETSSSACIGVYSGVCMVSSPATYAGSSVTLPKGSQECSWTGTNGAVGTYTQGATSLILNSCGGTPPVNQILVLDQANDTNSDPGGIFVCDTTTSGSVPCDLKGPGAGNYNGRVVNGVDYSQQQYVWVTGVSGSGSGPYTVSVSPGVYFNNIRAAQSPGAFWMGTVSNVGIENLALDYSQQAKSPTANPYGLSMVNCYQCWVKNIRSLYGARDHVNVMQSLDDVVRDSYFYEAQSHGSESYAIEPTESSAVLIENNIFQQTTNPVLFNQGSGWVIGYNLGVGNEASNFMETSEAGHNAGSGMNLWEGNSFTGIWCDNTWGSSDVNTVFRNQIPGWGGINIGSGGPGFTGQTIPIILLSSCRGENVIGNILGQPNYHTNYHIYANSATTTTPGSGQNYADGSIYELGTTDDGGNGNCNKTSPSTAVCDPLVFSTLMRWGNWDVVNNATQWNAAEASPKAVPYINANFTSSYFTSLSQALPNSLYYSSTPSWWPSGKAWPSIGPDVSSGNIGVCTGTYAGSLAISAGQCIGGTLSSAFASHVTSIPAQDCYLNTMGGPPDGSGNVLNFEASTCYTSQGGPVPPPAPSNLTAVVQ